MMRPKSYEYKQLNFSFHEDLKKIHNKKKFKRCNLNT